MKQKPVWILCGAPGCGKSTFARNYLKTNTGVLVSRDKIRLALLNDNDSYFANEDEVFKEYIRWAQDKLNDEKCIGPVIMDATQINERSRKKVYNKLNKNNISEIHYFYFTTPFNVCWERNSKRQGREFVPKSSIRRMYLSMTDPINDSKINTPVVIHYIDEYGNEIKKI